MYLFSPCGVEEKEAIKPHGRLVLVRSRIAPLARPTYQPGGLPGAFSCLAAGETVSWEELGA
jgi:hypothetical protein